MHILCVNRPDFQLYIYYYLLNFNAFNKMEAQCYPVGYREDQMLLPWNSS